MQLRLSAAISAWLQEAYRYKDSIVLKFLYTCLYDVISVNKSLIPVTGSQKTENQLYVNMTMAAYWPVHGVIIVPFFLSYFSDTPLSSSSRQVL